MGGGSGGGSTTSENTTTTTTLPEYAEPYFIDLADRAKAESNRPYQPYQGQRLAQLAPEAHKAFRKTNELMDRGSPEALYGARIAAQIGGADTEQWVKDTNAYVNPYINQVLDTQQARAERRYQEQTGARNAKAVQAGAFGGSRQAIANSMARRDFNEQSDTREGQAYKDAYDNAQRMAMGVADTRLNAAQATGQLGQQYQNQQLQQIEAGSKIAAQKQQQRQAELDIAYTDYTNQRDYPRQQLSFYNEIIRGLPVNPQSEITTRKPAPSAGSQLAGAGLGAAGIYSMLS